MGKILGNRYELLEQIGGGGMAVVYLAKDTFLDRLVAVKLLRDEYTDDQDFIRRFHKEAKAVASLSHPNIVSIYDFGEEGKTSFLVMEYVEGRTLKSLIQEEAPLPVEQVVDIGRQICAGISEAHAQNIVHKDIKPHNILVDRNGIVKVTDFGIAQAVDNMTITHNKGILGSAHYFSPEQAKGEPVDFRSDIYSIGVVLYEMVTGHVPFNGENPVTVALKHIQNSPVSPRKHGFDIPLQLDWIIMKALAKDPASRFASAQEMEEELAAVATGARLSRGSYDNGKGRRLAEEPVEVRHAQLEDDRVKTNVTRILEQDYLSELQERNGRTVPEAGNNKDNGKKTEKKAPTGRKVKVANLIVVLLILLGLGAGGFYGVQKLFFKAEVVVPNVINNKEIDAERALAQSKLAVVYDEPEPSDEVASGYVLRQDPEPGSKVKEGREVTLVISSGQETTDVPNVVGKSKEDAILALEAKGLSVGTVAPAYDATIPENSVILQSPKSGEQVEKGASVDLIISKGKEPEMVTVPSVIGQSQEEAKTALQQKGLNVGSISNEESTQYASGIVINQSLVAGGQTLEETAVDLVISSGPGPAVEKSDKVEMLIPYSGPLIVEVIDDEGKRLVYNEFREADDYLSVPFTYTGKATVNVYSDKQLVETKSFE